NRAAFITAWTFCSGTGSGLYLLTLFTDLMASRASMSSQTVRFGVMIISVSGLLLPPVYSRETDIDGFENTEVVASEPRWDKRTRGNPGKWPYTAPPSFQLVVGR